MAKSKPPQREVANPKPSPVEQVVMWMTESPEKLINMLPANVDADRFMRICMADLRRNPKLLQCSPVSIYSAVSTAAAMGLEPGVPGQGNLVPYGPECQFLPGAKGLTHLVTNGGRVSNVEPVIVRENDDYETTESTFRHTYDAFAPREKRGRMIGAYVRMTLVPYIVRERSPNVASQTKTVIMSREQILEVAEKSRSYRKGVGPWHGTETDQEEMWKKTVIIRACKTLPLNAKQQKAIKRLNEQDGDIIDVQLRPIKRGLKETLRARSDIDSGSGPSDPGDGDGESAEPEPAETTPTVNRQTDRMARNGNGNETTIEEDHRGKVDTVQEELI